MFVDCILCYGGWFLIHCHCSEFIEWIKLNQEWGWVVIERVWVSEWMSEVKTHFPPNKCLDRIDLRLYASFHIQIILIHFLAIMLLACAICSERLVVSAGFSLLFLLLLLNGWILWWLDDGIDSTHTTYMVSVWQKQYRKHWRASSLSLWTLLSFICEKSITNIKTERQTSSSSYSSSKKKRKHKYSHIQSSFLWERFHLQKQARA